MKRIFAFYLLSVLAWGQLATQDSTPIPVQSKRSAADSLAFGANVASGHELIVAYQCFSGGNCATGPSISDTLTTTWTSRVTQGSTQCGNLWIWTGQAGSSGADTVTITNGGSFKGLVISEWANVSNTLDVASQATGWSSIQTVTSPSITTTANGSLIFTAAHTCNSGQFGAVYPTMGLTDDGTADSTASGWKIAGTNGSYTTSFKYSSSGSSGNIAAIAMKATTSLSVATNQIPDASTSAAYSFDLKAQGGSGSYSWDITSGTLPCSLSLSAGGTISGTPTCGNGDASITFRATDGASATATKSLTIHTATSFNTVSLVQSSSPCGGGGTLGTVTSGNLILLTGLNAGQGLPIFTDSLGTAFSYLPVAFEHYSASAGSGQSNFLAWGFAPSTGSDTLTCTGSLSNILAHEFSNVQKTFDAGAFVITLASTASPYTSGSITAPVAETLFSWVNPFTSGATITTQSPYTAGATKTAASTQLTAEYKIGASSGSQTASYAATGNTDGNWAIALMGFRPTSSGTAPTAGGLRHRSQVY